MEKFLFYEPILNSTGYLKFTNQMINFKQKSIYENRHFSTPNFIANSVKEISFIQIVTISYRVRPTKDYGLNMGRQLLNHIPRIWIFFK